MSLADSPVVSAALPLAAAVAALAGLVSFASPCVLPLVPGFLGYVTGLGDVDLANRRRSRTVLGALLFVLGFSVVFLLSITAASAVGAALVRQSSLLTRIGGALVLAMSVVFLGFGSQREVRSHWRPAAGLLGAPLLGAVFGLGWTPCIGPTLGAIMALAAPIGGDAPVARGVTLGTAYCLGLGLPFVLVAAGWSRAGRASAWLRAHQRGVQRVGGGFLMVVGVLMVSGLWEGIMAWVQVHLVSGFEPAL
jgi:cytochrome c-type biogenesis protein